MIKNYIVVALRNLWRNKSFSFINIIGLAISLSVCLVLISMLVQNYSYDNFHVNKNRIYRIIHEENFFFNQPTLLATAPVPLAKYVKENVAGIQDAIILKQFGGDLSVGENTLYARGLYTNESFFKIFSFAADPKVLASALKDPFSIVLTKTAAKKYFGDLNPLSKNISITDMGEFTVTGIMPDPPSASHIKFEVLISISTLEAVAGENKNTSLTDWNSMSDSYVYVLIQNGGGPENISALFPKIVSVHYPDAKARNLEFTLQPFTEIAPSTRDIVNEMSNVPDVRLMFSLFGISVLIMVSAGFNYTNLSVARALTRAREIGIRKTSGAKRSQIFYQFIIEAIILSFFALVLAIAMMQVLQDAFLDLLGPMNQIEFSTGFMVYVFFLVFTILVGFGAGFMPASILSRFDPAKVLKDVSGIKLISGLGLRKALIIFQFVISIVFIISASVIQKQFRYAMSSDLGFDKDNIVNVELKGNDYQKILNVFSQHKDVVGISASAYLPATNRMAGGKLGNADKLERVDAIYMSVDENFISNLKMQLVAGENFPSGLSWQREQFIVLNERAVKWLGFRSPSEALGRIATFDSLELRIIGVVKDFHYRPVDAREPIGSFAFRYNPSEFNFLNIRLKTADPEKTVAELEGLWKTIDSGHPFSCHFFVDQIQGVLNGYRIMSALIRFVSFLAISLACLGLLGMAIYTTQIRQKEIAIRKVLGASSVNLIALLSRGFIVNLTVAVIIASPLAYFVNHLWLDQLPYKIEFKAGMMLNDVFLILAFGLITIGSQTYKAAIQNPIKILE